MGISGPSGSGKTFAAILIAKGLVKKPGNLAIIDTERSADKYAGRPELGSFKVIPLYESKDPDRFSPASFIAAMKCASDAGVEALIIDSASHEWYWCTSYLQKLGGRYQDWSKVTPLHDAFLKTIIQCSMHVIVCFRSKTDYVIVNEPGKKASVEKVGLRKETRDGAEYEVDLMLNLNAQHFALVEKSRVTPFKVNDSFLITESIGQDLKAWTEEGTTVGEC
ncbi:MAG: AAA family ATPase [Proteobacteria bacterium]|nr:MAG: AAA family ATPase [Pseudomonadota bacterium]